MFHPNGLYLFNIFCSHRLILVHLLWKSRRTLSDMQKINKAVVTFPHIHRQHKEEKEEEEEEEKKNAKIRTRAVSFSTQKLIVW